VIEDTGDDDLKSAPRQRFAWISRTIASHALQFPFCAWFGKQNLGDARAFPLFGDHSRQEGDAET
jgi:hypothetical protein